MLYIMQTWQHNNLETSVGFTRTWNNSCIRFAWSEFPPQEKLNKYIRKIENVSYPTQVSVPVKLGFVTSLLSTNCSFNVLSRTAKIAKEK